MAVLTGSALALYRLRVLQRRLELEARGFTFTGRSSLQILKSEGIIPSNVRTKKQALGILTKMVEECEIAMGIREESK